MRKILITPLLIILCYYGFVPILISQEEPDWLSKSEIIRIMQKVHDYQSLHLRWPENRNWNRSVYYTGVMAFYQLSEDDEILQQAISWAERQEWEPGNEWLYPANRLACVQVYLEIFFVKKDSAMIVNSRKYMDANLQLTEPAYVRGWDYIDALFVGPPAYAMMSKATGDTKYEVYMNKVFREVADQLFDTEEALFYRDSQARFSDKSSNGNKSLWSRGNGWAMASLPGILKYLPMENPERKYFTELLKTMAASVSRRQTDNGFWSSNLADSAEYPMPESSGTALFTYALAWGINNGLLDLQEFKPTVIRAWKALCSAVNNEGKVCWGQPVGRKPSETKKDDSDEFVTGAFLLAASEVYKLVD